MGTQRGWTLIELSIVVLVLSLLCAVALPAARGGLEAARGADARADLLDGLRLASHRAALTGVRAVLCPSADGQACLDSADWSGGWIAFLDPDADRERTPAEPLLLAAPALAGDVRLRSTAGRTRIVFQGSGGNAGSNVTFTLCDGRGPARARALILGNAGTLRDGAATAANLAATCVP